MQEIITSETINELFNLPGFSVGVSVGFLIAVVFSFAFSMSFCWIIQELRYSLKEHKLLTFIKDKENENDT